MTRLIQPKFAMAPLLLLLALTFPPKLLANGSACDECINVAKNAVQATLELLGHHAHQIEEDEHTAELGGHQGKLEVIRNHLFYANTLIMELRHLHEALSAVGEVPTAIGTAGLYSANLLARLTLAYAGAMSEIAYVENQKGFQSIEETVGTARMLYSGLSIDGNFGAKLAQILAESHPVETRVPPESVQCGVLKFQGVPLPEACLSTGSTIPAGGWMNGTTSTSTSTYSGSVTCGSLFNTYYRGKLSQLPAGFGSAYCPYFYGDVTTSLGNFNLKVSNLPAAPAPEVTYCAPG